MDRFARLSTALYNAERDARAQIQQRMDACVRVARKDRTRIEDELRKLARDARLGRSGSEDQDNAEKDKEKEERDREKEYDRKRSLRLAERKRRRRQRREERSPLRTKQNSPISKKTLRSRSRSPSRSPIYRRNILRSPSPSSSRRRRSPNSSRSPSPPRRRRSRSRSRSPTRRRRSPNSSRSPSPRRRSPIFRRRRRESRSRSPNNRNRSDRLLGSNTLFDTRLFNNDSESRLKDIYSTPLFRTQPENKQNRQTVEFEQDDDPFGLNEFLQ